MRIAYVDSSCALAMTFEERGAKKLVRRLREYHRLLSSDLLEADLRSALAREGVSGDPAPMLARFGRVRPDRPLTRELQQVLAAGTLGDGELWHLACAVYLRAKLPELEFLTLNPRQAEVAGLLGFPG